MKHRASSSRASTVLGRRSIHATTTVSASGDSHVRLYLASDGCVRVSDLAID